MKQRSFTKFENALRPEYRDMVNNAESTEDVRKFFGYTVRKLFDQVFEGKVDFDHEDVLLDASGESGYRLSERLRAHPELATIWEESDLDDILQRFAQSARHRFIHLSKNPNKTQASVFRAS